MVEDDDNVKDTINGDLGASTASGDVKRTNTRTSPGKARGGAQKPTARNRAPRGRTPKRATLQATRAPAKMYYTLYPPKNPEPGHPETPVTYELRATTLKAARAEILANAVRDDCAKHIGTSCRVISVLDEFTLEGQLSAKISR